MCAYCKNLLRYLKGTKSLGLKFFANKDLTIKGYVDADYAGDIDTRRSTSGMIFLINNSPIVWKSQTQKCVALSTAEAEYMSLYAACTECIWLIRMIKELGFQIEDRVIIRCDSKSAIHIAQNPVHCKYSKHIDTRYHFISEILRTGVEGTKVEVDFIRGESNCSDVFTKPLGKAKFREFKDQLDGSISLREIDLESDKSLVDLWDSFDCE